MKKILITVLVVAAVATLVNDIGRYGKAYYDVDVIGTDTADNIALGSKATSRDKNAIAAATYAAARGATVYMYDQDDRLVRVWVEMPVTGTWLLQYVMAARDSESEDGALKVRTEHKSYWKS
jgi:hypothetical protein